MKNSELKIWQTDQPFKVLKNKEYTKRTVSELSVKLYGNETESVRFYITPKRNVRSLRISAAELGPSVKISVGYVLYVNVEKSSAGTRSETGLYPDAVLPFEIAQKQGLNTVEAGENQEIYIRVKTEKEAVAGEYLTQLTVWADDEKIVLPLRITVWDYVLPEKNRTRQYFILDEEHLRLVEGDAGFQAYKKYYEQLLQYRVNGSRMPFSLKGDYRTVTANYIENLRVYYPDERITVFALPVFYTEANDDVDYARTEYVFNEVVEASVRDGVDYFEKALTYLWILDEPHLSPMRMGYCQKVLPKFELLKNKIASACAERAGENAICGRLAKSVKDMPNLITAGINAKILADEPDEYSIAWCPPFDNLSQHEFAKMTGVLNKGEKWWYGCNWPAPPYPTYHIDDRYLSPRVLSWIQYAYNVTGNLYWRINYWAKNEDGKLIYIDPYEHITYPTTNGEGMLVYPGRKFGTDGFVPSIRLEAIRDGIEDYEALCCLQELLEENARKIDRSGVCVNELLQPLYTRLFNKTMIVERVGDFFDEARAIVANILLAASKYSFTVLDFDKDARRMRFYAERSEITAVGGSLERQGDIYTATTERDELRLILQGDNARATEITFILTEVPYKKKYALSDCWAQTVKKYNVQDCCPENIVKPYYDILDDASAANYNPCCKALAGLIGFVWRTEAAIVKKRVGDEYEIGITVPAGTFRATENYETRALDEKARRYTFLTKKKTVSLEVENEKGKYKAELYVY